MNEFAPIASPNEMREPPHNIEAEQVLLGALLLHPEPIDRVADMLRPEHFYFGAHGRIYAAILAERAAGRRPSPVTLRLQFEDDPGLADVGGAKYLVGLYGSAIGAHNVDDYAAHLITLARRRHAYQAALEYLDAAATSDDGVDPVHALLSALETFDQPAENGTGYQPIAAIAEEAYRYTEGVRSGEIEPGIQTGLRDLDRVIGGLAKGDLIILGGRPGMGKSLIAQGILTNVARRGTPVALVSLEMSPTQIGHRAISPFADVPYKQLRSGHVSAEEINRVAASFRDITGLPIWVDTGRGQRVSDIRHRARRVKRDHGIGLLVVDYMQLIRADQTYRGNKVAEVGEISLALKTLAGELDIPLLVLSQLSRDLETRDDKRPRMSDLRWSGDIEQDADTIIFAYRAARYAERPQTPDQFDAWNASKNVVELIVAKNRQGEDDTVEIYADMATGVVGDLVQQEIDYRG